MASPVNRGRERSGGAGKRAGLTSSLLWSLLEQGGARAVGLIVQIALARLLAPDVFGVLAVMFVFIGFADAISQGGLGTALIQRKDVDDAACNTALWLSLAVSAGMYLILFLAAPFIADFYGMPEVVPCLRALSLTLPLSAANSIQRSLLQKRMGFREIFKANIAAAVASGGVGIGLALAGFGVWALVAQTLSQALIACLVMLRFVSWRIRFELDGSVAGELFSYGWKVCATGLLGNLYNGVSELILGKVCTVSDLGLYSQGRKWPNTAISVATNGIQNVMFPAFSELQDDPDRFASTLRRALAAGTFVIAPSGMLLAACARPLVTVLLTDRWADCVFVFQLTSVSSCWLILQLVNLRAYMALGDSGLYLKLQVVKVGVLCIAIWSTAFLTRDIDLTAAAATLAGFVNVLAVDLSPAKRMHGVGGLEQVAMILPSVALSAVAAAVTWSLTLTGMPYPAMLCAQITLFAIAYLLPARFLDVPGCAEAFRMMGKIRQRA